MPKDRLTLRLRTIALGGLSVAMLLEGAGCSLLPARKVPPEPPYSAQTQAPSPAGFGSQAPPAMGYGSGAPSDSMPPLGSYGPGGMASGMNQGGGMPMTNPALAGSMPGGPMDPSVNPALGMPGSMPGSTAPAGYSPTLPSAGGAAPSGYGSTEGYSSPMLQDTAPAQSQYNMGTPGAAPAPL